MSGVNKFVNGVPTGSQTVAAADLGSVTDGSTTDQSGSGSTIEVKTAGVTNAKLANMVNNTIKGNNAGSTGVPLDLTATQVTALLNAFTSTLKGLVPASGGGTTTFLRADGTFATPAGGGGSSFPANSTVNVTTATTSLNAGDTNKIHLLFLSGITTITMPTHSAGQYFFFKDVSGINASQTLTFQTSDSSTFDNGPTSITIYKSFLRMGLYDDGTNWWVI